VNSITLTSRSAGPDCGVRGVGGEGVPAGFDEVHITIRTGDPFRAAGEHRGRQRSTAASDQRNVVRGPCSDP